VDEVIREEEDDLTQEMRALVLLGLKTEVATLVEKIQAAKVPVTDEWTDGLNAGLEWAVRILNKDKSAT
jgi:hypothetical protein